MRFGRAAIFIVLFVLVVVLFYLAAFNTIEYMRRRNGPWQVSFLTDAQGVPAISIRQPKLQIQQFEIVLHDEKVTATNLAKTVSFDKPMKPVPFGKVIYQDLTSLPGVVTLDLFGHEIELLPRTLIVNRKHVPWDSSAVLHLTATNKLTLPPKSYRQ